MTDNVVNGPSAITEEEAKLYDRQIRLWGLDAQKRLRGARVLLIGIGGLGAEVAKNIVLAGIKSLTVLDHAVVTKEEFCNQFFVSRTELGKNRGACSLPRIQQLNPMVEVSNDEEDVAEKPDEFFSSFDIVCATCCPVKQLLRLNSVCRKNSVKFFAGDVFGYYGFMFVDLIHHEYSMEVPAPSKPSPFWDENGPAPKKARVLDSTTMVKKEAEFCPLSECLDTDWSEVTATKLKRSSSNTYFIMQMMHAFREARGRGLSLDHMTEDSAALADLRPQVLDRLKVQDKDIVPPDFAGYAFAGLSPVCAIVGGVLGQEIIKAVSQRDPPHNNFFFYNGVEGSGMVDMIKNSN